MKRIGIISDTHSHWDDKYLIHFADCDEIWHAGDIGSEIIIDQLEAFRPVRAVYGNIDGAQMRRRFKETLRFCIEDCEVLIKHIGGYPGRYDASIRKELYENPPQLFVSGHSHILKVIFDNKLNCLHINPGAAGKQGWQLQRTLIKISIEGKTFKDLEIIELA